MEKSIPVPDRYIRAGRKAIDLLNTGKMTVYQNIPHEDEETGITEFEFKAVLEDIPCRLSYQDKQSATKNEPAQALKSCRVVTSLDYIIPEGSILKVTFNGYTQKFKQTGKPHRNDFRQSIPVETYEEHAVREIYEGEYECKD